MSFAVISPVGISLFRRTYGNSFQERARELAACLESDRLWDATVRELKECLKALEVQGRIEESCAEVKSVLALRQHRRDEAPDLLILLPTATPESILCSRAVEVYFEQEHGLRSVTRPVKGMDSSKPAVFQHVGLRTFLNELSWAMRYCKERGLDPVFNATPGFKAETSLALLLAQFVGASVFYIHEMMSDQVIMLPSLPLTITEDYWKKWGDLVLAIGKLSDDVEHSTCAMDAKQFNALADYRLRHFSEAEILFEDISLHDGQPPYKTLSALGQVLYEAYKGSPEAGLDACGTPPNEKIQWPSAQHHWPRGFESAMTQIARLYFVREIRPKEFSGATSSACSNAFEPGNPGLVTCRHFGGDYGAEARIFTTAKNHDHWGIARREIEALLIGYGQIPPSELSDSITGVLDTYGSVAQLVTRNSALQAELENLRGSITKQLADQRRGFQQKIEELQHRFSLEKKKKGRKARKTRSPHE